MKLAALRAPPWLWSVKTRLALGDKAKQHVKCCCMWLTSVERLFVVLCLQVTTYSILDILARAVVSFMLFGGHDALGDGEAVSQREFV